MIHGHNRPFKLQFPPTEPRSPPPPPCHFPTSIADHREMDKYVVRRKVDYSLHLPSPISRRRRRIRWKRSLIELDGRFRHCYRHDSADLLVQSYSEIGSFRHSYDANVQLNESQHRENEIFRGQGISCIDFDNKGYYLASVTRSGSLFVHDFETLYHRSSHSSQGPKDLSVEHVMHVTLPKRLDVVRWNIANQDEVACSSRKGEVFVFDVGYISSDPIEILKARHLKDINGSSIFHGFSDIVFASSDASRLYASSTSGAICTWDRRQGVYPCLQLKSDSQESLNSVKLCPDNQIILGAGNCGIIYLWDVRGGRMAATSHSHKESSCLPFTSIKVATLLRRIKSLQVQSDIVAREIHSIDFDPSCQHHLAFHLDDGWSGVLDLCNLSVTHIHCPPPTWLNGDDSSSTLHWRRPSWLPSHSIYVVGSVSQKGIHLLDFFPNVRSASRVDYSEDSHSAVKAVEQGKVNKFVPLSNPVVSCTVHPFDSTIIAGTEKESLLVISQTHGNC
ncbi:hypothetical protein MLD38_011782 [Melastoma candidum]|uniref:Uncharacterized protein n=1 Tax=Melastoma candidum TaxID=119954 RepID=A0ACB9R5G8_9MYRT|nr:hypothetical protein MLD38_011782 [Melastoma candidum]